MVPELNKSLFLYLFFPRVVDSPISSSRRVDPRIKGLKRTKLFSFVDLEFNIMSTLW